jgi:hypothetical protein
VVVYLLYFGIGIGRWRGLPVAHGHDDARRVASKLGQLSHSVVMRM